MQAAAAKTVMGRALLKLEGTHRLDRGWEPLLQLAPCQAAEGGCRGQRLGSLAWISSRGFRSSIASSRSLKNRTDTDSSISNKSSSRRVMNS